MEIKITFFSHGETTDNKSGPALGSRGGNMLSNKLCKLSWSNLETRKKKLCGGF
jgi:hypothetical protein